jgi:hypothetical protein
MEIFGCLLFMNLLKLIKITLDNIFNQERVNLKTCLPTRTHKIVQLVRTPVYFDKSKHGSINKLQKFYNACPKVHAGKF